MGEEGGGLATASSVWGRRGEVLLHSASSVWGRRVEALRVVCVVLSASEQTHWILVVCDSE